MIKNVEPIAKLRCSGKSMILRPFARAAEAARTLLMSPTPRGLAKRKGRKRPQKGGFNGYPSFATGSVALSLAIMSTCFGSYSIEQLSVEEKVGQVLMPHFHGEIANKEARTLIQETKVGGIIYYNWSNGLTSPAQVRSLSDGLQHLASENSHPIPLLIAVDQEGGVVARLTQGFTIFPGNRALGMTDDPDLAEASALAIGRELQAVGINMNLAPVVDVNSNPRNPVIGIRSFSDIPEKVVAFGEKALSGYRQAGIVATLKHFPGHGDTTVDSHEDLPVIRKSKEELEQVELLPFTRLALRADAIMTAHILVPALDPDHCSTLSAKTLSYLRESIGFQGVIIADSLVMEGVLKACQTVDEAAIQAFNAGCDIILLGGRQLIGGHPNLELTVADVKRVHQSLVTAVKTGRIAEARLNQAVEKILRMKEGCLNSKTTDDPVIGNIVNSASHQALAEKIACLALQTIEQNPSDLKKSIHEKKISLIAPQLLRENIDQTSLLQIGKTTNLWFFSSLNPSSQEIESARQFVETSDLLLVFSYNAWKNPSQAALIESLLDLGKPLILVVARDPLDASLFPKAHLIFDTFSPTGPSIQAVCENLQSNP